MKILSTWHFNDRTFYTIQFNDGSTAIMEENSLATITNTKFPWWLDVLAFVLADPNCHHYFLESDPTPDHSWFNEAMKAWKNAIAESKTMLIRGTSSADSFRCNTVRLFFGRTHTGDTIFLGYAPWFFKHENWFHEVPRQEALDLLGVKEILVETYEGLPVA